MGSRAAGDQADPAALRCRLLAPERVCVRERERKRGVCERERAQEKVQEDRS